MPESKRDGEYCMDEFDGECWVDEMDEWMNESVRVIYVGESEEDNE